MTDKLKVLSLFAGIGGFDYGLEKTGGFETVAFCEFAEFPRRVLARHWPGVPCFPDVRELKGTDIGPVDVICGGYPCQPFSTAGKRQGKEDDRHLWPEFSRLVDELRPAWVIGENVAGHISMGLDDVLADLEAKDYACRTFVIPACAVGASHRRDRVWIVANSDNIGRKRITIKRPRVCTEKNIQRECVGTGSSGYGSQAMANATNPRLSDGQRTRQPQDATQGGTGLVSKLERCSENVAHSNHQGSQGRAQTGNTASIGTGRNKQPERCGYGAGSARGAQSRMGGVVDGLPRKMDGVGLDKCFHAAATSEPGERVKLGVKDRANRLKALGNAVHPDIPMIIGYAILDAEKQRIAA